MRRWGPELVLVAGLVGIGLSGCDKGDTVTAPALGASCAATPSSGPAPLTVSFALAVSGAEGTPAVAISYGDGMSGTDPDVTHTYVAAGLFTASFTVNADGQTARCATTVEVGPGPSPSPSPTPPGGNLPPDAVFKTTPDPKGGVISGTAPFSVRFNMCPTTDPEGDTRYYTMDFQADGKLDARGSTGASCRHDFVYAAGTWHPEICVTDLDPDGKRLHDFQCMTYKVVVAP
jgi:PKD domain